MRVKYRVIFFGLLYLCGAGYIQWLLGDLKFSTLKAEWIFRFIYLCATIFNCLLASRRHAAGPFLWKDWLVFLPMIVVNVMLEKGIHGTDAQGAIFIFLLPFFHLFSLGIFFVCLQKN